MNAEITPTEMTPFSAKYAPKAATITKEKLLSMFINGPMALPITSAMIPVLVSASLVVENSRMVASCRL